MAGNQINSLMSKMDVAGKVKAVMNSDTFKGFAGKAASLGIID